MSLVDIINNSEHLTREQIVEAIEEYARNKTHDELYKELPDKREPKDMLSENIRKRNLESFIFQIITGITEREQATTNTIPSFSKLGNILAGKTMDHGKELVQFCKKLLKPGKYDVDELIRQDKFTEEVFDAIYHFRGTTTESIELKEHYFKKGSKESIDENKKEFARIWMRRKGIEKPEDINSKIAIDGRVARILGFKTGVSSDLIRTLIELGLMELEYDADKLIEENNVNDKLYNALYDLHFQTKQYQKLMGHFFESPDKEKNKENRVEFARLWLRRKGIDSLEGITKDVSTDGRVSRILKFSSGFPGEMRTALENLGILKEKYDVDKIIQQDRVNEELFDAVYHFGGTTSAYDRLKNHFFKTDDKKRQKKNQKDFARIWLKRKNVEKVDDLTREMQDDAKASRILGFTVGIQSELIKKLEELGLLKQKYDVNKLIQQDEMDKEVYDAIYHINFRLNSFRELKEHFFQKGSEERIEENKRKFARMWMKENNVESPEDIDSKIAGDGRAGRIIGFSERVPMEAKQALKRLGIWELEYDVEKLIQQGKMNEDVYDAIYGLYHGGKRYKILKEHFFGDDNKNQRENKAEFARIWAKRNNINSLEVITNKLRQSRVASILGCRNIPGDLRRTIEALGVFSEKYDVDKLTQQDKMTGEVYEAINHFHPNSTNCRRLKEHYFTGEDKEFIKKNRKRFVELLIEKEKVKDAKGLESRLSASHAILNMLGLNPHDTNGVRKFVQEYKFFKRFSAGPIEEKKKKMSARPISPERVILNKDPEYVELQKELSHLKKLKKKKKINGKKSKSPFSGFGKCFEHYVGILLALTSRDIEHQYMIETEQSFRLVDFYAGSNSYLALEELDELIEVKSGIKLTAHDKRQLEDILDQNGELTYVMHDKDSALAAALTAVAKRMGKSIRITNPEELKAHEKLNNTELAGLFHDKDKFSDY
ncbi:hypothetical protein KY349_00240, partial [Candidatus Woesearchaeota archaeon]|nr:hypothetical protein [Candidatus Woesearchaeota archaeon]